MTKRHLQEKLIKKYTKEEVTAPTRAQDFILSTVEAVINTAASMLVFVGFGLPISVVLGLTLTMFLKNIGIRRIFAYITQKRKAK
jgi:hypothetical protein